MDVVIIINLTPHDVVVVDTWGQPTNLPCSGVVARAEQGTTRTEVELLPGVPLHQTRFGAPVNLPDPEPGTYLIVSLPTVFAAAAAGRETDDLLIPAEPVRDDEGRTVGCRALATVDLGPTWAEAKAALAHEIAVDPGGIGGRSAAEILRTGRGFLQFARTPTK